MTFPRTIRICREEEGLASTLSFTKSASFRALPAMMSRRGTVKASQAGKSQRRSRRGASGGPVADGHERVVLRGFNYVAQDALASGV
jgi:hypothetical protein